MSLKPPVAWFQGLRDFTTWCKDTTYKLPQYTVTSLPPAAANAQVMVYVSNETGGAVPAFSDGTNWRRVTDRAIVS